MPISDLPMSILFVTFLMLFVLIGIYPAWKRTGTRIRRARRTRRQADGESRGVLANAQPTTFELSSYSISLNDFEIFIVRRLAQAGPRGLSRRELVAALHFEPMIVKSALVALRDRGLVALAMPLGFGTRFSLSGKGRDFAIAQGYLPRLHLR